MELILIPFKEGVGHVQNYTAACEQFYLSNEMKRQ